MKIDFYQKALKEQAQKMMDHFFQFSCPLDFLQVSFNEEVCSGTDGLAKGHAKGLAKGVEDELIFGAPVQMYDASSPTAEKPLKDVTYFGPAKVGKLGLFSTFMELRRNLDFS